MRLNDVYRNEIVREFTLTFALHQSMIKMFKGSRACLGEPVSSAPFRESRCRRLCLFGCVDDDEQIACSVEYLEEFL